MKPLLTILALLILAMAGGLYYQFYYPPSAMRNATEAALQQFADAVDSQDRAKVSDALTHLITDDAKIHLEVNFFSISNPTGGRPMVQDFDKQQFISFIDNILYTLSDFHYEPRLREFALSDDRKTAAVGFASYARGNGPAYYSGVTVTMRFSTDTTCTGRAVFNGDIPKLAEANCNVLLRSVPIDSDAHKLRTPEAIQDFLQQH